MSAEQQPEAPSPAPPPAATPLEGGALVGALEALLFAAGEPLDLGAMAEVLARSLEEAAPSAALRAGCEDALEALTARWGQPDQGMMLVRVAKGWTFRTQPGFARVVRALAAPKPRMLSRAALETLAIVAYRQPVTRGEVEHIRGVDCGATFKVLSDRDLVRTVGKKDDVGRPLLWGTTRAFLGLFTLGDLDELPSLREVQDLSDQATDEDTPEVPSLGDLAAGAPQLAAADEEAARNLEEAVARLQASEAAAEVALRPLGVELGGAASAASP